MLSFFSWSQYHVINEHEYLKTLDYKGGIIEFKTTNELNSHFITLNTLEAFFNGTTFSQNIESNILGKLQAQNRVFSQSSTQFNFRLSIDDSLLNYPINKITWGFENRYLLQANVNDQLVNLILNGNSSYKGENLLFKDNQLTTQQLFGISFRTEYLKKRKYNKLLFSPKISLLNGQNLAYYQLINSALYTSELGDSLSSKINFNAITNHNGIKMDGLGIALDLKFIWFNPKNLVQIEINDIGGMRWQKRNTKINSIDTTIQFQGIELINMLSNDSTLLLESPLDIKESTANYNTRLPSALRISFVHTLNDQILLNIQSKVYLERLYYSTIKIGNDIVLDKWRFNYGTTIESTGKNYFHLGFAFQDDKHNRIQIQHIFDPSHRTIVAFNLMGTLSF